MFVSLRVRDVRMNKILCFIDRDRPPENDVRISALIVYILHVWPNLPSAPQVANIYVTVASGSIVSALEAIVQDPTSVRPFCCPYCKHTINRTKAVVSCCWRHYEVDIDTCSVAGAKRDPAQMVSRPFGYVLMSSIGLVQLPRSSFGLP